MSYNINNLHTYILEKNIDALKWFKKNGDIEVREGRIFATDKSKKKIKDAADYWNQLQQATKILLNSLNSIWAFRW